MYTIANVKKTSNLSLAYKRLLTNPESTYKNYFRDVYSSYGLSLDDNIKQLNQRLTAGYLADPSIRVFMPKSNGLNRMYTLLSIEDQIVYQAYANIIAESTYTKKINKRYKKTVFGNLLSTKGSEFFYQPWQNSYKSYTKAVIRAYQSGCKYIASFDLTACYDSINHSLLRRILTKYGFSDNCASDFIRLVSKWETCDGLPLDSGIPQGPQASGIVAEIVLSEYDEYIEKLQKKYSFKYFRYVDDIRILSEDEGIVRWILFLLDKKSKELGLFPQASKITVHEITNIDDEVKRISKPLFDEDFDESLKSEIARKNILLLLKEDPADLTTIKRYFHFVEHSSKNNAIAIKAVTQFPNMVHSFAYYIMRYPRKLPKSITDYIYSVCEDSTQQFAAGILLEAAYHNISSTDMHRFSELAKKIIREDKANCILCDSRFKAHLILLVIDNTQMSPKKLKNLICNEKDWWIKKTLLNYLESNKLINNIYIEIIKSEIVNEINDVAIMAASKVINTPENYGQLPKISEMLPSVQNTLKRAGLLQRGRNNNSQISKYIYEITATHIGSFKWRKTLGKEHNQLERNFFIAQNYWKTDLNAFVNILDVINDRICSELVKTHQELGGYTLGKIGSLKTSVKFPTHVPQFYLFIMEIHKLRSQSNLSHAKVVSTGKYTGLIPQKERRRISNLMKDGMKELLSFW